MTYFESALDLGAKFGAWTTARTLGYFQNLRHPKSRLDYIVGSYLDKKTGIFSALEAGERMDAYEQMYGIGLQDAKYPYTGGLSRIEGYDMSGTVNYVSSNVTRLYRRF